MENSSSHFIGQYEALLNILKEKSCLLWFAVTHVKFSQKTLPGKVTYDSQKANFKVVDDK